ncbi:hypothetical protein A9Q84_18255 [Halobacteriovorax marinus]|uniref:Secreted protein n=1 Tax=Halobacteriovorax marinus TaxID=97084 RepID=A0A1Y5F2Z6_9BACT|nr:hypothetical protein A9Q84_18255 [Halobacteriovorax marinus]
MKKLVSIAAIVLVSITSVSAVNVADKSGEVLDCKIKSLLNADGTYSYREIGPETKLAFSEQRVESCPMNLIHAHTMLDHKRVMYLRTFDESSCSYYANTGLSFTCFKK